MWKKENSGLLRELFFFFKMNHSSIDNEERRFTTVKVEIIQDLN